MSFCYFDQAATTRCHPQATEKLIEFTTESFGNPSSSHTFGQKSARAVRDARLYFARFFQVDPEQVIFTGSGTEANNLALYGPFLKWLELNLKNLPHTTFKASCSAIEHPAVKKTIESMASLGAQTHFLPVDSFGHVTKESLAKTINTDSNLVSIMRVNNIIGSLNDVVALAAECKRISPKVIFHSDCIQAFGKVEVPNSTSQVDLLSISAHKIGGPKGVGALVVLNPNLLKNNLIRPLIWGGEQEFGLRSGTLNAGLISAFHIAAEKSLGLLAERTNHYHHLRNIFREALGLKGLLTSDNRGAVRWNSSDCAAPYIVNLSTPSFSSASLARFLENAGFIVSTGSACSSGKTSPDAVLTATGASINCAQSALRVSFGPDHTASDVTRLADEISFSIDKMKVLLMGKQRATGL